MRTIIAALAAALINGVASGAVAAATNISCSVETVSNNGLAEVRLADTVSSAAPCSTSVGSSDADALGHRVAASSQAEPGRLGAMSSSAGSAPADRGFFVGANASNFVLESGILVGGLPDSGAQLDFRVHVHGTLDSNTLDVPFPFNSAVFASSEFRATLINEVTSASVSVLRQACVNNPNSSVSTCNIPAGSSGRSTVLDEIVPMSVFARNGDTLFVSLLLDLRGGGSSPRGNFVQATADFSNTIDWLGVVPSGAPPGLTLTAASGFDYVHGVSSPVPEPASWALWVFGLAIAGAVARRR